jgi:hypothetical protein
MENQIPLFVLKEVFDYVKEAFVPSLSFNDLLGETCDVLSPFLYPDIAENERKILIDAMAKEPHFLGCLHKSLSVVLDIQPGGEERMDKFNSILQKLVTWIRRFLPTVLEMEIQLQKFVKWIRSFLPTIPPTELLFPNGMSAVHLARAGIKFKSFSKMPDYIRLDKESGTLYLPHIIVGDISAEVYLRNMLALEFNDALRPKYVTRYVALMGTLVQSPDDVRLLVDRQLISRGKFSLTDECIAQMWHDLRQPFLRGSLTKVHSELIQTFSEWFEKSYWKKKIARKVCGVYEYVSSWKFIAPLAAFLGLLMTAIQTYCSLYHCSR